MKKIVKISSFLIVLAMAIGVFFSFSVIASAATENGSIYSSNSTIAERIDKALAAYKPGSSFFTKNGKACSCHASSSINCVNSPSNCNCLRKVTIDGKTVDLLAVQCFGYARYWQQMLFGAFENNTTKFQKITGVSCSLTTANTKDWFTKNKSLLHPGTHIRCYNNGHSIVVLSVDYNKGTVTYVHSNWVNQSTNNGTWDKVMPITTKTFAQFASTFSTLNYAYVYKNYYAEYPDKVLEPIATEFKATIKDGIYSIKNAEGGKMLTVSAKCAANGTPLVVNESNESVQQQFYFKHVVEGKYRIYPVCSQKNGSVYEMCVDTNIEAGNSSKLEIGDFFDTWKQESKWDYCQLFYIVPIANGKYTIELASMPQAVLGVKDSVAAETDGGAITLQNYTSSDIQRWYFYDASGNDPVDPSIDGAYSHTISYNANGGIGAPASQRKVLYISTTLSSQIPEKEGYSFVGWRSSDGTMYHPGAMYGANANLTLYAVWEQDIIVDDNDIDVEGDIVVDIVVDEEDTTDDVDIGDEESTADDKPIVDTKSEAEEETTIDNERPTDKDTLENDVINSEIVNNETENSVEVLGCNSSIALSGFVVACSIGVAFVCKKKEE